MVRVVPAALRQAALALGFAEWRASIAVVLPAARPGIVTGVLLAVARVAGETAPLLFTAFGNQFWSLAPMQPMAALPLQLYADATSPYDGARRQAWAAALLLVVVVALLTISARWLVGRRGLRGR
jgi:phosphate transport system permease protein